MNENIQWNLKLKFFSTYETNFLFAQLVLLKMHQQSFADLCGSDSNQI